jgi:predicted unusual protein kinase regulating ubiquinone biosynthesis (AarF/ABC1/UbiB family)
MGVRIQRVRRAAELARVARSRKLLRVLREVGVVGARPATRESAREFRRALEELGTTFVKLGQLLSSRPDMLPDVYIEELGRLVDEIPAVPFAELAPIVHGDLGADAFSSIDPEPTATASVAQIHPALLRDGREVVVKIRRPGIEDQVELDLDLLRTTAASAERHFETARMLQLEALADELETHLRAELDFREEASNAELIARIVSDFDELVVPRVVRPLVTERVLVLERVRGTKVSGAHALEPERAARLARAFFSAYVQQVCTHGVYHADPHRGNVFLTDDRRLALLDFGLLGRLDDDTRTTLALLLLAVARNRSEDVAGLLAGLSLTTLHSDEAGFLHEIRRKLPRYHWRPLAGIHVGESLADLQRIALRHGIRLPPSFALVGKTLAQADTIARLLDPALDPIELLRGESVSLMLREAERRLRPDEVFGYAFTQLEAVSRLPVRIGRTLELLEAGQIRFGVAPTGLDDLEHLLRSVANRVGAALIVVGLLVSSALMSFVDHTVAIVGFSVSAAVALYMTWRIARTPGAL